jgi:hypothetical protein
MCKICASKCEVVAHQEVQNFHFLLYINTQGIILILKTFSTEFSFEKEGRAAPRICSSVKSTRFQRFSTTRPTGTALSRFGKIGGRELRGELPMAAGRCVAVICCYAILTAQCGGGDGRS